jgi:hypothetical protein
MNDLKALIIDYSFIKSNKKTIKRTLQEIFKKN